MFTVSKCSFGCSQDANQTASALRMNFLLSLEQSVSSPFKKECAHIFSVPDLVSPGLRIWPCSRVKEWAKFSLSCKLLAEWIPSQELIQRRMQAPFVTIKWTWFCNSYIVPKPHTAHEKEMRGTRNSLIYLQNSYWSNWSTDPLESILKRSKMIYL